jgi:hypothetical protein
MAGFRSRPVAGKGKKNGLMTAVGTWLLLRAAEDSVGLHPAGNGFLQPFVGPARARRGSLVIPRPAA